MKYTGNSGYQHGTPEKMGVLMVNLGTPDAPETKPVRRYLKQFLSDPRIIELPRWLWMLILHGVILRVRPKKSAEAYREVWSDTDGSPLLSISKKQAAALQTSLQQAFGEDIVVALGMRYGTPSVDSAIAELEAHNVRRVLVLPMYPQYSGTTTASVFDEVAHRFQRTRWLPELRFVNQYSAEPTYITALANSVRKSWQEHGQAELLVTSYHGIPKRYLLNGDPYHCQCHQTTRLLAEELGLSKDQYRVVFQSRVGNEEWLKPYCDETMKALPADGIRAIDIISPAFSADCLETLEEIQGENCEYFMENGGETFNYIPCLNDSDEHIEFLKQLVIRHTQGWPETDSNRNKNQELEDLATSAKEANALMNA
ncbi:MAG: ferrochelatase [Gammaproteobacteria bacterium]|nr:ferrochelatase [Gammaproteobacteria bacterium]